MICKTCHEPGHREGSYHATVRHSLQEIERTGLTRTFGNRRIPTYLVSYRVVGMVPGFRNKRTKLTEAPVCPTQVYRTAEVLKMWGMDAKQARTMLATLYPEQAK